MTRGASSCDCVLRLTELADCAVPFAIRVVAALRIADRLASGPRTAAEVAAETGADGDALQRVLRVLAARGVFSELEPGRFALTKLAQPLLGDHPLSLRDAFPLLEAEVAAWSRANFSVRTGQPAFDVVHGRGWWQHLRDHAADSAVADRANAGLTELHLRTVLPAFNWAAAKAVVDVGGGTGAFLAGLLRRYPALRGVLVDQPQVVRGAAELLDAAGVAERCAIVACDFFTEVPAGGDVYVLKTVLPGFDDEHAVRALRSVRRAMSDGARLLLLEAILPPGDTFDVAKLVDVQLLVVAGGAHRTREQLGALLARVGFEVVRVTRTATLSAVEASAV